MLSIIVPVYGVEEYLRECLDSIRRQTYQDWEMIIVDDGSPDSCPEICDHYASLDNRITVIHQENQGLVAARKVGLQHARGQYVAYVDSDDWIEPQMYQELMDCMVNNQAEILLAGFTYEVPGNIALKKNLIPAGKYEGENVENAVRSQMISCSSYYHAGILPNVFCKIFKKDLLIANQMLVDNEVTIGEDMACTYGCLLDAEKVVIFDEEYRYHYRYRPESMSRMNDNYRQNLCNLFRCMDKIFLIKKREDMERQFADFRMNAIERGVDGILSKRNRITLKKRWKLFREMVQDPEFRKGYAFVETSFFQKIGIRGRMHRAILEKKWHQAFLWAYYYLIQKNIEYRRGSIKRKNI